MKRFFTRLSVVAFTLVAVFAFSSCSKDDINDGDNVSYELRVLTFEDADYVGSSNYLGNSDWSSLIDYEYGSEMLSGEYAYDSEYDYWYQSVPSSYVWYDENNTELTSTVETAWGSTAFSCGGQAISSYTMVDFDGCTYSNQLSVPCADAEGNGGYNGSKNFCVHYLASSFSFEDSEARIVDHMYVMATSYLANSLTNGDSYSSAFDDDNDYLLIVATGYNGDVETTSTTYELARGASNFTSEWDKWDLSSLGAVTKVTFTMEGSDMGDWGLNTPAYFAFDDVAVRFDIQ